MRKIEISDLVGLGFTIIGIIGVFLIFLAVLGLGSHFIPPLTTETLELEVTTEDSLPVNHQWVELPKGDYKMDISISFRPYIVLGGIKFDVYIYPTGINYANFSLIANNTSMASWGWSEWSNDGENSFNFKLNSSENITLKYFFTLENSNYEFEANWEITVTEIDDLKKLASDLKQGFWSYLIYGGIALGLWIFVPDRL